MKTGAGTEITAGAVILTGGIGTFAPRPLPAGEEFLGRGLTYFVPDSSGYADRDVVIVGGGDSAVDWALMLHPIARSVTLVHRRDRLPRSSRLGGAAQGLARGDHRQRPGHRHPRRRPAGAHRAQARDARSRASVWWRHSASPPTSGRSATGDSTCTTTATSSSTPRCAPTARHVRRGRHRRLRRKGPTDRDRLRRGRHGSQQRGGALDPAAPLFPGHSTDPQPTTEPDQEFSPCRTSSPHPASTSWTSPASRSAPSTASTRATASSTSTPRSASTAAPASRCAPSRRSARTGGSPTSTPASWRTTAASSSRCCRAATRRWARPAARTRSGRLGVDTPWSRS